MKSKEICWECGESVALGSGKLVNRIPDFNSLEVRKDLGYPHPEGDYLCADCEAKFEEEDRDVNT